MLTPKEHASAAVTAIENHCLQFMTNISLGKKILHLFPHYQALPNPELKKRFQKHTSDSEGTHAPGFLDFSHIN